VVLAETAARIARGTARPRFLLLLKAGRSFVKKSTEPASKPACRL
jgi:hypothetical protein